MAQIKSDLIVIIGMRKHIFTNNFMNVALCELCHCCVINCLAVYIQIKQCCEN